MPMNESLRLFFAIEVPEEMRNEIARFGETLDRSWKPSHPGQLHITLAFMGAVPHEELARVVKAGEDAASRLASFSLAISDTAVFPETGEPRVLYAQADGGEPLLDLANNLRQQLVDLADTKKVKPHLTLARNRGTRSARRVLRKFRGNWEVAEFVLFKSVLTADGANHEALQRFRLNGAASVDSSDK